MEYTQETITQATKKERLLKDNYFAHKICSPFYEDVEINMIEDQQTNLMRSIFVGASHIRVPLNSSVQFFGSKYSLNAVDGYVKKPKYTWLMIDNHLHNIELGAHIKLAPDYNCDINDKYARDQINIIDVGTSVFVFYFHTRGCLHSFQEHKYNKKLNKYEFVRTVHIIRKDPQFVEHYYTVTYNKKLDIFTIYGEVKKTEDNRYIPNIIYQFHMKDLTCLSYELIGKTGLDDFIFTTNEEFMIQYQTDCIARNGVLQIREQKKGYRATLVSSGEGSKYHGLYTQCDLPSIKSKGLEARTTLISDYPDFVRSQHTFQDDHLGDIYVSNYGRSEDDSYECYVLITMMKGKHKLELLVEERYDRFNSTKNRFKVFTDTKGEQHQGFIISETDEVTRAVALTKFGYKFFIITKQINTVGVGYVAS